MVTRISKQSQTRSVFVIDPALKTCELDCFNQIIRWAPEETLFSYFAPGLFGMTDLIETRILPRGIIILGSGASVHDQFEWQDSLVDWLQPMMLQGIPTLGICYGHQLLAHLFGGTVELGFGGQKKRGVRQFDLHPNNRFMGAPHSGNAIISHREVVTSGGVLKTIGSSAEVPIEVVEHPEHPIWGFQAHIEATPAFIRNNGIPLGERVHDFRFGQNLVSQFLSQHLAPSQ